MCECSGRFWFPGFDLHYGNVICVLGVSKIGDLQYGSVKNDF